MHLQRFVDQEFWDTMKVIRLEYISERGPIAQERFQPVQ